MNLQLILKLNNQTVADHLSPVRILNGYPTLSWMFDTVDKISVDPVTGITSDIGDVNQAGYKVEIGTIDYAIGTSDFVGNVSETGVVSSQELFWSFNGFPLQRGITYYGQVYAIDELESVTDFATFSFFYNSLPVVSSVEITPSLPAPTDNLVLSYNYLDDDGDLESGTTIRWFKNGSHQRQFDNAIIINSSFLQNNDIWSVDVYPSDGFEHGLRVTSPQVKITSTPITVDESSSKLSVLPSHPNPDDIIEANYELSDEFESENVFIRWYVNNQIMQDFNDLKSVKLDLEEGDEVRFEVKHKDASFYSSAETVAVVASNFVVTDIQVDGRINPLDVSTVTPHVRWKRFVPSGKSVNYISIQIGTFFESSNIYSTVITGDRNVFTIPANTLEKGIDYYIGIALSDTQTFNKYTTSHFRVDGSRWEKDVSNSTGWTIETMFVVASPGDIFTTVGTNTTTEGVSLIHVNNSTHNADVSVFNSDCSHTHVPLLGDSVTHNHTTTGTAASGAIGTPGAVCDIAATTSTISSTISDYQTIRINDGDRFAEVRLYSDKISLISGSTVDYSVSTVTNNFLTIAGQNDDIKIYLNRSIIINGEGIFTQESNIKRLELSHDGIDDFPINYKYFFYTTSGYFLPGVASEYSNLQFHDYIEFQNNEVVALQGYVGGKYVFGLNSDNESESSTIYSIGPGDVTRTGTIARTYSPINNINRSPDGTKTVVAHANGVSIITGYLINPFDHEMIFVSDAGVLNETFPTSSGWELVKNISIDSAYFDTDGFHIDTL
jgi:hypothetical protein